MLFTGEYEIKKIKKGNSHLHYNKLQWDNKIKKRRKKTKMANKSRKINRRNK